MEIRSRKSLQRTWDEHLHQQTLGKKLGQKIDEIEAYQAGLRDLLEKANEDHGRALMERADAVDQAHDYRELVLAACEQMRWPIPETPEELDLNETGPHPLSSAAPDGEPSLWAEPVGDLPQGKPEWLPPHDAMPAPDTRPDVERAGAHPLPGGDLPGPGEFHPDPRPAHQTNSASGGDRA